ncbi:MAG: hypothetical protein II135_10045 [Clostridia bacterium]|nr:hypothetical protein [Clostridia bacterium]
MKKAIFFVCAALTLALLFSCSLFNNITNIIPSHTTPDTTEDAGQPVDDYYPSLGVDLDALSFDELSALYDKFLQSGGSAADGAGYDLYYKDVDISAGANENIGAEAQKNAQTAKLSDEPWIDKDYETLDITANMSNEEKAAYEAAMGELEDFDASGFQKEIDEMLKGMEGFEDYDPPEEYTEEALQNEWPDNALSRQVPKPPFSDPLITSDTDSITVLKNGGDLNEVKSYIDQLKKAGFDKDVYEKDNSVAGVSIYTFNANNGKGVTVSVTFAAGTATVNITKN